MAVAEQSVARGGCAVVAPWRLHPPRAELYDAPLPVGSDRPAGTGRVSAVFDVPDLPIPALPGRSALWPDDLLSRGCT